MLHATEISVANIYENVGIVTEWKLFQIKKIHTTDIFKNILLCPNYIML
jgi:hypothetical protein